MAALALVGVLGWASTSSPGEPKEWREALGALNAELAGATVLVTPRPAGAMVRYYVPDAETVLDSSDPADLAGLRRALESRDIEVVLRWGGSTEPGGAARSVIRDEPPDGRQTVGNTHVSWWRLGGLAAFGGQKPGPPAPGTEAQ
jgi:hypothetical protein